MMNLRLLNAAEQLWLGHGRAVPAVGSAEWTRMLKTWRRYAFWGMR